jgi:hypothetical protein
MAGIANNEAACYRHIKPIAGSELTQTKRRLAMVLLNTSETAKELRVHPCTIHRIGKKVFFTPEDIEQYLKRCAVPVTDTANGGA